jgi:hypothetical protein
VVFGGLTRGILKIYIARDERGKRRLGILPGVCLQQGQVVIHHFTDTFTPPRKANRLFLRQTILSGC